MQEMYKLLSVSKTRRRTCRGRQQKAVNGCSLCWLLHLSFFPCFLLSSSLDDDFRSHDFTVATIIIMIISNSKNMLSQLCAKRRKEKREKGSQSHRDDLTNNLLLFLSYCSRDLLCLSLLILSRLLFPFVCQMLLLCRPKSLAEVKLFPQT